jgi:potassium/hydrogen antiporter
MEIAYVVVFLGILIFLSHLFDSMFERTRIPNAFLLLLIGIVVGPISALIKPSDFGQLGGVFTTITLIVILFESGLSLKFTELKKAIGTATALTVLNFLLAMVVMSVLFYYLSDLQYMGQQGWISAFFLGSILGGTSSAVVIPMVRQLKLGVKGQNVLVLESALSDVLCLVVGLALLDSMKAWEIDFTPLFNKIWQSFLFAILIGLYAGLFWVFIHNRVPKFKKSMFSTFAFAFVVYGLTELAGFNGGIATLAFGIILGNSEAVTGFAWMQKLFGPGSKGIEFQEKLFYSEIVFILQTYFFVYIGINIRFGHPSTYIIALIAIAINIFMRVITVKVLPRRNLLPRDRTIISIMTPKGLVPAVLASMPLYLGMQGGELIQEITYAVVFVSILVCSLLVIALETRSKHSRSGATKDEAAEVPEGAGTGSTAKNVSEDDMKEEPFASDVVTDHHELKEQF